MSADTLSPRFPAEENDESTLLTDYSQNPGENETSTSNGAVELENAGVDKEEELSDKENKPVDTTETFDRQAFRKTLQEKFAETQKTAKQQCEHALAIAKKHLITAQAIAQEARRTKLTAEQVLSHQTPDNHLLVSKAVPSDNTHTIVSQENLQVRHILAPLVVELPQMATPSSSPHSTTGSTVQGFSEADIEREIEKRVHAQFQDMEQKFSAQIETLVTERHRLKEEAQSLSNLVVQLSVQLQQSNTELQKTKAALANALTTVSCHSAAKKHSGKHKQTAKQRDTEMASDTPAKTSDETTSQFVSATTFFEQQHTDLTKTPATTTITIPTTSPVTRIPGAPKSPADFTKKIMQDEDKRKSIVTIQALFRGRLERKGVELERRLSQLPVDLPSSPGLLSANKNTTSNDVRGLEATSSTPDLASSTPSVKANIATNNNGSVKSTKEVHRSPTPTRLNRRNNSSTTPLRAREIPGIIPRQDDATGVLTSRSSAKRSPTPTKSLSIPRGRSPSAGRTARPSSGKFLESKVRTESDKKAELADLSPRRGLLRSQSVTEAVSNNSVSIEFTESSDSVVRGLDFSAVDTPSSPKQYSASTNFQPPPKLPPPSPNTCRVLFGEMKSARKVLEGIDVNWTIRVKCMNKLEELVRKNNAGAAPGFWKEIEGLKKCIATQIEDLRSSIVREACRLLIALADTLGFTDEFADLLTFLLPILFKRLYVTIKCISEGSDQCIKALLARSRSIKFIPQILKAALTDSHNEVRRRCSEYLTVIFERGYDENDMQQYCPKIEEVLRKNTGDSDKDVRASSRQFFAMYRARQPEDAERLFSELPASTQRALKLDEKKPLATPSTGTTMPNRNS